MPQPYKLSPAHRVLERLGARWSTRGAWRVAASFEGPPANLGRPSLSDLSHTWKLEVRGRDLDAVLPAAVGVSELPAPGSVRSAAGATLMRFTREQVLLHGNGAAAALALPGDACAHATERTSGLACFLLSGAESADILSRLTALDLRESRFPDRSCARAPMAGVNAWIARIDRNRVRAYTIFVSREYGEYLWSVLWQTGHAFELRPAGVDEIEVTQ